VRASARATALRSIALELERCSNHVGDLACWPRRRLSAAAAFFGALRGDFLNLLMTCPATAMAAACCARAACAPISTRPWPGLRHAAATRGRELRAHRDADVPDALVMSRFDGTGIVTRETAEDLGLVGPRPRSGCVRDVRLDYPTARTRFGHIPVAVAETGDVAARPRAALEVERSLDFLST